MIKTTIGAAIGPIMNDSGKPTKNPIKNATIKCLIISVLYTFSIICQVNFGQKKFPALTGFQEMCSSRAN